MSATEPRGDLTITVRHSRRGAALDALRAISGLRVGIVDTSFCSHTIVTATAPAKAVGNGLPEEIRSIKGVIDVQ